jgi:hypothetical protein
MTVEFMHWILFPAVVFPMLLDQLICSRLASRHPDLYLELGEPKLGASNIGGAAWKLQKLGWGFGFLLLRDALLSTLCVSAMVSWLVFSIACLVSFLMSISWKFL